MLGFLLRSEYTVVTLLLVHPSFLYDRISILFGTGICLIPVKTQDYFKLIRIMFPPLPWWICDPKLGEMEEEGWLFLGKQVLS